MKVIESALLLVVGTALITFSAISFVLWPRPLSLENPTLLMQVIALAGVLFIGLGARGIYRVHLAISPSDSLVTSQDGSLGATGKEHVARVE